ncbi:signal peptidase II [Streptomyces sp. NPDC093108]|uniref:signal peptidase II n=1 Tax=Streptomyces sp. NPDC093108 TaxID=3366030 RepID=UPI0038296AB9
MRSQQSYEHERASGSNGIMSEASKVKRPRFVLMAAVAALLMLADLITKQIALANYSLAEPVSSLGGFLKFTLIYNSGAAFSLGEGSTWLFSTAKLVVIIGMLWISRRIRIPAWEAIFGLLVGGAAGNLVDRVFRPPSPFQGEVIDWIQFPHWPAFNIADMGVVCGGVLTVWMVFRGINLDGSIEPEAHQNKKDKKTLQDEGAES